MREVDRKTIERGIPGSILMENAGMRAVEFLDRQFGPLSSHRIVIVCGKGNNGGDGFVLARQILMRRLAQRLYVVGPEEQSEPRHMFEAAGGQVATGITPEMRQATIVVDAVLGTGVTGSARGASLEMIREINSGFPNAKVLAIDLPSGMNTDSGSSSGEVVRADATITFTAPKLCHVLAPNCDRMGRWSVGHIGSHESLMADVKLHLNGPRYFRQLLADRPLDSNKGSYGHVLVVGGAPGKAGAAEMAGLAALRSGAGLVTVACSADTMATPELMTGPLSSDFGSLPLKRKDVIAMGPGLGHAPNLVRETVDQSSVPLVLDADALNSLDGAKWRAGSSFCVITPHPGEMARLAGAGIPDVQKDRLAIAQHYSAEHGCAVVLKGHRTVIAFPDGRAWINPTGSPAMATGGTGDILTGLIAGFIAQADKTPEAGVLAAVYLHGLAGRIGAGKLTEQCLLATDLLTYLPEAIRACRNLSDED